MQEVRPAANADAAEWLLGSEVDWWDLVRYGPPGFDVYLRIALSAGCDGADPMAEAPGVRKALAALAGCTSTPNTAYVAIWEGWTSRGSRPEAPRLPIPNRGMLLFTGPLERVRDAPALAWHGSAAGAGEGQEPHLVWPEDRAWCLACEVDEEIEFTVGCSGSAARVLAEALPSAVRRAHYGEPAPLYLEPE